METRVEQKVPSGTFVLEAAEAQGGHGDEFSPIWFHSGFERESFDLLASHDGMEPGQCRSHHRQVWSVHRVPAKKHHYEEYHRHQPRAHVHQPLGKPGDSSSPRKHARGSYVSLLAHVNER